MRLSPTRGREDHTTLLICDVECASDPHCAMSECCVPTVSHKLDRSIDRIRKSTLRAGLCDMECCDLFPRQRSNVRTVSHEFDRVSETQHVKLRDAA